MKELKEMIDKIDGVVDEVLCFFLTFLSLLSMFVTVFFMSERIFGITLAVMSLCSAYLLVSLTERNGMICALIEGASCILLLILAAPIRVYFCGFATLPKFYRSRWKRFLRLQEARGWKEGDMRNELEEPQPCIAAWTQGDDRAA